MKRFQMKKLAVSTIVAATMFAATSGAQAAGSATANFNVNINLTPACGISTAAGSVDFTYSGMQTSPATVTGTTIGIKCTTNLPYSVSLATAPGYGYGPITDQATGLDYTLTLNGTGADLTGQTGNGAEQVVNIDGAMAADQAGSCPTAAACSNASSTNRQQTLTLSY
jgi:spore coat protein U-like protein